MSSVDYLYDFVSSKGCNTTEFLCPDCLTMSSRDVGYWALQKDDALTFIRICRSELVLILGIDVLTKLKSGMLEYNIESFCFERKGRENWLDSVHNAAGGAESFIQSRLDATYLFVFTVRFS